MWSRFISASSLSYDGGIATNLSTRPMWIMRPSKTCHVKARHAGKDVVAMFARPAAARSAVADGDDDDAPVAAVERVDEPDDAGDAPPVAVASPSEARP